jgi:hypothetical protein
VQVRRGRQVGDRRPAVAGQLGEQRVILGPEPRSPGRHPGLPGARCRVLLEPLRRRLGRGLAQRGELAGGQGAGVADVRDRGEHVQDGLRRDGRNVTAAGQAAQEQRVPLLRGPRLQRADDLGAA